MGQTEQPQKPLEQPQKPPFRLNDVEVGSLVRTKSSGTYKVSGSKAWGRYLAKVADPEGTEVPKKVIGGFTLKENFPKIPSADWSRYISLCYYMCPTNAKKLSKYDHDTQYEVQVCLLRDQATLTKWKLVVPKQVVTGTHVDADLRSSVDLETGEEYTVFPPIGWLHAGSSHSHNTMSAFFSSVDDASELNVPGLHIVIGDINHKTMEYEYEASIVLQKQRKEVDLFDVAEVEPVPDSPFHPRVLDYISVVLEKNRSIFQKAESQRYSFPGLGFGFAESQKHTSTSTAQEPSTIKLDFSRPEIEDENGKLNSFYRFLDRNNSDLFDGVPEEVDLCAMSDSEKKSLFKEEALDKELFQLAKDDEDAAILRDILKMENS